MRSPSGKAELLDRLFSYDFNGDWRTLGEGVAIKRLKPHVMQLTFPESGRTFELTVRIPRHDGHDKRKRVKGVAIGQAPPTTPEAPAPTRRKRPARTAH